MDCRRPPRGRPAPGQRSAALRLAGVGRPIGAGRRGAAAEFDQGVSLPPPREALWLHAGAKARRVERDCPAANRADCDCRPALRCRVGSDPRSRLQLGLCRRQLQSPPRADDDRDAGLPEFRRSVFLHVGRVRPGRPARIGRYALCVGRGNSGDPLLDREGAAIVRRAYRAFRPEGDRDRGAAATVRLGRGGSVSGNRL